MFKKALIIAIVWLLISSANRLSASSTEPPAFDNKTVDSVVQMRQKLDKLRETHQKLLQQNQALHQQLQETRPIVKNKRQELQEMIDRLLQQNQQMKQLQQQLQQQTQKNQALKKQLAQLQQSSSTKRLALLIGNANYQYYQRLTTPVNDMTDLATVLRQLDFEVMLKTNLNQEQMKTAIQTFGNQLREHQGVGLFYFAGHGTMHQGHNYLIPMGANRVLMAEWQSQGEVSDDDIKKWQSTVAAEAINANEVLNQMRMAHNPVNILILEASHHLTVPGLPSEISLPSGLTLMTAADALIAYAASPGNAIKEGKERNSLYVKHLMKWIPQPNMRVVEVLEKVRAAVLTDTNGMQVPDYSNKLNTPFYFNRQAQ